MAESGTGPSGAGWPESPQWLARARRLGPLRYSDLGRRDLAPVGPDDMQALAEWIAGTADHWWEAAGRPDPYTLVVASGDDGHLAQSVLAAGPRCARALRYVLVHPNPAGPSGPPPGLARLVRLEEPAFLYPVAGPAGGPSPPRDPDDGDWGTEVDELEFSERPPARGIGPLATFLTDVPALGEVPGGIIAVELLSRLPYELYERAGADWFEIRLATRGEELVEMALPANSAPSSPLPKGTTRWRRLTGALDWLRRQLPTAEAGVLAVVDRWSEPGDTEALDLEQLRHVREPVGAPAPQPVEGTRLSVVSWRLG